MQHTSSPCRLQAGSAAYSFAKPLPATNHLLIGTMLALRSRSTVPLAAAPSLRRTLAVRVACQASGSDKTSSLLMPAIGALAAAMVLQGGVFADEALAAKSSGRVSGSSGFAARKAPVAASSRCGARCARRGKLNCEHWLIQGFGTWTAFAPW
jgi:hypothetical protein